MKIALAVIVAVTIALLAYFTLVKPAREEQVKEQARIERVVKMRQELAAKQKKEAVKKAEAEAAAKVAAEKAEAEAAAKAVAEAKEAAEKLAKMQAMGTVKKGEGVERAFIRQLIEYPSIVEGIELTIGKKQYDLTYQGVYNDTKAIKKWAGRTAHLIAIFTGLVDRKTGRQIRVKVADKVAYSLFRDTNEDGKQTILVMVYSKKTKAQNQEPAFQLDEEPDYQQFVSLDFSKISMIQKDKLQKYEYLWQPARE